jgi:hypothetical protein
LRYRNNRNNKGNAFEINDSIQQFAWEKKRAKKSTSG